MMNTRETLDTSLRGRVIPGRPLSMVTICLDKESREMLKLFADSVPLVRLRAELNDYRVEDQGSIRDWIGNPPPDICLIDFDNNPANAAATIEIIHTNAPETAIFAVSSQTQSDLMLIIQAMRSGCSEFLIKPINREQLLSAVLRVGEHHREETGKYHAQVMAFMGAKGGCGVTTLVTQLGTLLADFYSRKVLVVDLHSNSGDVALYLGVTKSRYHSFDLIESADRLDAELLQSLVVHHSTGLDIVPSPEDIEPVRHIEPSVVAQTFDFLRSYYEFILVDLPTGLDDQNLEFIRYADHFYFITVAEVSALRNVAREIDYLAHKEISQAKIRVILNRHEKRGLITNEQIEKSIKRRIFWKVPNQYASFVKAIQGGDPLARLSRSDLLQNLKGWAEAIGGKEKGTEKQKKESRGFLGILGR